MKRTVPLYEVVILALLLVFAVYFFALYQPTERQLDEIQEEKLQTQSLISAREKKQAEKKKMEKAIEEATEKAGGIPTPIPEYSNINTVIAELHAILGNTVSYSIDFKDEQMNSPIVTRDISIACTVENYASVFNIIRAVHDSPNACFIKDVTWTDKWADYRFRYGERYNEVVGGYSTKRISSGRYSLNMEIRCYEYCG